MAAETPTLELFAWGLLSKWGFGDGDMPEEVMDYLDAVGRGHEYVDVDWHVALRKLVRRYLLPALAEHHQIEVYDIDTIHNPIRAAKLDGQDVDHYAEKPWDTPLTPESVVVPWSAIADAMGIGGAS
jgi:hypothetical protein